MRRILVTGGAGFIGSHLADLLLERGHRVRILDSLLPQVHGEAQRRPAYLAPEVELVRGDVRDPLAVRRALEGGVDAVVHLAAAVGVGQSMYQIAEYTAVNELGTAVLLEALAANPAGRLVVASSMSVYGEGLARAPDGSLVEPGDRSVDALKRHRWEPEGPAGEPLAPAPTPETKRPALSSVYALGKYAQERMCLIWGRAYGVPVTALRFFNVYGTRQALSNPYTGVLAIFASRLLNGNAPMIFEDGLQRRDFVHVRDVARACLLALERPEAAAGEVVNVGSGVPRTVEEVARGIAEAVGRPDLRPQVTGRYRVGDIRHCYADTARARDLLGFEAREDFQAGLAELSGWLAGEVAVDRVEQATDELRRRGLVA
jgi:dTDP-L-rhamnose 4-epimerase